MNLKQMIDSLAKSQLAGMAYTTAREHGGAIGVALFLAVAVVIGVLLGYDMSDVQAWFAALGE